MPLGKNTREADLHKPVMAKLGILVCNKQQVLVF
jgi:hypothetical protein